jgi:hypothetical protein
VTARVAALGVAAVAIVLVLAQDLYPGAPLYHTWQYALMLGIALAVLVAYANAARRGDDGVRGRRLLLATAGAATVVLAGLASGLLGPDTAEIAGTPGTVVPLPALGAAAFFGAADAATIEHGSGTLILRRRNAPEIVLGGSARRLVGESLVYLEARPAAYVDVTDTGGAHLTVTQPTNASFLSPVLLFHGRQRIGAVELPLDTFSTPARHRLVRALYFTPQDLAQFRHAEAAAGPAARPVLVLSAADDGGNSLGIVQAQSGSEVALGGLRVHVTLGTYPVLAIAAVPPTWMLIAGIVLFLAGLAWSALAH